MGYKALLPLRSSPPPPLTTDVAPTSPTEAFKCGEARCPHCGPAPSQAPPPQQEQHAQAHPPRRWLFHAEAMAQTTLRPRAATPPPADAHRETKLHTYAIRRALNAAAVASLPAGTTHASGAPRRGRAPLRAAMLRRHVAGWPPGGGGEPRGGATPAATPPSHPSTTPPIETTIARDAAAPPLLVLRHSACFAARVAFATRRVAPAIASSLCHRCATIAPLLRHVRTTGTPPLRRRRSAIVGPPLRRRCAAGPTAAPARHRCAAVPPPLRHHCTTTAPP